MNWININVTTLDSEEFLGSSPIERATWLCLMRYCCGQENGGRIAQAKEWKDRKWQQVVRVTLKEVMLKSDLWGWSDDALVVNFYPEEKEIEVREKREVAKTNGKLGGRPKKTNEATDKETQKKPTLVISGKAEGERKEKGKEREGEEEVEEESTPPDCSASKPLCTIDQAIAQAPMARMTEDQARVWWHTRNSSGWTKGSTGGGAPRKITSWHSDMATSVSWVAEAASKAKKQSAGGRFAGIHEDIDIP